MCRQRCYSMYFLVETHDNEFVGVGNFFYKVVDIQYRTFSKDFKLLMDTIIFVIHESMKDFPDFWQDNLNDFSAMPYLKTDISLRTKVKGIFAQFTPETNISRSLTTSIIVDESQGRANNVSFAPAAFTSVWNESSERM